MFFFAADATEVTFCGQFLTAEDYIKLFKKILNARDDSRTSEKGGPSHKRQKL